MSVDVTGFLPGAYSQRDPQGGTPNPSVPDIIPAFIARTRGKSTFVTDEVVAHGSENGIDSLAKSNVRRIIRVSRTEGGPNDYEEGNQYSLSSDQLDWSAAKFLPAPVLDPGLVETGGSGTWTTGVWYFVITATNSYGETLPSNEISVTIANATDKVTLRWGAVPGAASYDIYGSQTSGSANHEKLDDGTAIDGALTEVVLQDETATGAVSPPVSNTASDEPDVANYYVSYEYADYSTLQAIPKKYTNLADVFVDHGVGSNAAQMAELAMSNQAGKGNGCPAVWIAGVQNDAAGEYQAALNNYTSVTGFGVLFMVMDKRTSQLDADLRSHVTTMNGIEERKERCGLLWNSPDGSTPPSIGDTSTTGTIVYDAQQSNSGETSTGEPNGFNMFHIIPDSGGATGLLSDTAGVVSETNLEGWHVAAAYVGSRASQPDAAEPTTRKSVGGLVSMRFTEYTPAQLKTLRDGGVIVVDNVNGTWRTLVETTVRRNGLAEEAHGNISFADKAVAQIWRDQIDPDQLGNTSRGSLIGRKISDELIEQVIERTVQALEFAQTKGLIRGYDENSISAVQGDGISRPKTNIAVEFSYLAFYPNLTVTSKRSFDTSG